MIPSSQLRTRSALLAAAVGSISALSASVTITVLDNVPNGDASGGPGSGPGALSTSVGTVVSDLGMPVTSYTVSGIDLTSVGGGASESFTFSVTYTATTDGTTSGSPQFNGFGNVSVTGGSSSAQVDGAETLTATVSLTSSTFAELTLSGFTKARAGGLSTGENATFTWDGSSGTVVQGNTIRDISGNFFTLSVDSGTTSNIEGFEVAFVAVPEPASALLLAGGSLCFLRRRRLA